MSRLDRVAANFNEYGDARIVPVDPELVRDLVAIAQAVAATDLDAVVGAIHGRCSEFCISSDNCSCFEESERVRAIEKALAIFEESGPSQGDDSPW